MKSWFIIPLLGAAVLLSSCEEKKKTAAAPPPRAQAPTITAAAETHKAPQIQEKIAPKTDPVEELIQRAEHEYQAGQANYSAGHLEAAKENFDRAFNVMVQSQLDIRSDDRLQNEFDKLVEGINSLELVALKEGDGFTEQRSEPAPIDEANEVTFPIDPSLKAKAAEELKSTSSDLPLVLNDPDDPAAQAVDHAARGLVAMFPVELPILQMATVGGGSGDGPGGPKPAGMSLPMAG